MAQRSHDVQSRMLRSWQQPATERIASDLSIVLGARVLAMDDLRIVDSRPHSLSTHYFLFPRFADMPALFSETGSVTASFRRFGVDDYFRLVTRVQARGASVEEGAALDCEPGTPLLITNYINVDITGVPIHSGFGRTIGERLELEFPGDVGPNGHATRSWR